MADNSITVSPATSKAEAKAAGLRRYFTGKPCKRGHVAERHLTGYCLECRSEWRRGAGKEYMREYQRARMLDPAKRAEQSARGLRHSKTLKAALTRNKRRERLRIALAGRPKPERCEVCDRGGKIAFDHCHLTGQFRGWLCVSCNLTVGRMKEDPALLRKLSDYIERHNANLYQGDWVAKTETELVLEKNRMFK